ncbi:hypothetical protein NQ317_014326 [Molorchus minor]|uniref:Uncharacterized protein n=1 Tax=Molorchus minor TaxID=1323400 RepID=A0ABQ9JY61_9CUCU|nr:hypothetical protein NQ317_014326 [Molorchus minor]
MKGDQLNALKIQGHRNRAKSKFKAVFFISKRLTHYASSVAFAYQPVELSSFTSEQTCLVSSGNRKKTVAGTKGTKTPKTPKKRHRQKQPAKPQVPAKSVKIIYRRQTRTPRLRLVNCQTIRRESGRKNATNAPSPMDTLNEKNRHETAPATPDNIATMCDRGAPAVNSQTIPFANVLRQPAMAERRGSCVKPCGHGTVAIAPYVPVTGTKRENSGTPLLKPFKAAQPQLKGIDENGTTDGAKKGDEDAVNASIKLHVDLPNGSNGKCVENGGETEVEMKNLINQEAKFQSQLNDLSKQCLLAMQKLVSSGSKWKNSNGTYLQNLQEWILNAANKECDTIRQRIKQLENELETYRTKHSQLTDQLSNKSELFSNYEKETTSKIEELEGVATELRHKIEDLEHQLVALTEEKEKLNERHAELLAEREEGKKKFAETVEHYWMILSGIQQTCKKKLEDKDKDVEEQLQEAYKQAEQKMKETEKLMEKVDNLREYAIEVEQLRDLTIHQDRAMRSLLEQHDQMKAAEESLRGETKKLRTLIDMEKENLQHMQRVHHQDLLDKERNLRHVLDEKRTEIAMYWEERLLHECGRLKSELEQIHNEEKWMAMESVRKAKDEDFQKAQREWEQKLRDCMKEVASLKRSLVQKDEHYRGELLQQQTQTDRDIMELRRLLDKIDMSHHNKYEKLLVEHETELEKINEEHEKKLDEVEGHWQEELDTLRLNLESVKEQMEKESQQKIEALIQQHRNELDAQWENLIQQKRRRYSASGRRIQEQFYTQQKSHSLREVELLKTIDSLKNELGSKGFHNRRFTKQRRHIGRWYSGFKPRNLPKTDKI